MTSILYFRNGGSRDPPIVGEHFERLSDEDERDFREHGHENLTYVADEVAGVASRAVNDKQD